MLAAQQRLDQLMRRDQRLIAAIAEVRHADLQVVIVNPYPIADSRISLLGVRDCLDGYVHVISSSLVRDHNSAGAARGLSLAREATA